MTLTIDLPESLLAQLKERQIPDSEIEAVVVAALEIWLTQQSAVNKGPFGESARPFVQRLIAENRELFETLAKR